MILRSLGAHLQKPQRAARMLRSRSPWHPRLGAPPRAFSVSRRAMRPFDVLRARYPPELTAPTSEQPRFAISRAIERAIAIANKRVGKWAAYQAISRLRDVSSAI